ncbi:MAG: hypothetical protein ABF665_02360 [Gluconacetobacter sp.]
MLGGLTHKNDNVQVEHRHERFRLGQLKDPAAGPAVGAFRFRRAAFRPVGRDLRLLKAGTAGLTILTG